jgi:hypothetical protein
MFGFVNTSFTVTLNHNQLQQHTINDCLRLAPFWLDYDCLLLFSSGFDLLRRLTCSELRCDWQLNWTEFQLNCQFKSKSKPFCDWPSVSQSCCRALIWGSWRDIYYCLTVTALLLWGALSDERTGPGCIVSGRTTAQKHLRCTAMDICEPHRKHLLRQRLYCCVSVLRALLRNESICHNMIHAQNIQLK